MYIHRLAYTALRNFVSIRQEPTLVLQSIQYIRPARERLSTCWKSTVFTVKRRWRRSQKAIESYGWYASLARNTRREHENQLIVGPRSRPPRMRGEMRKRKRENEWEGERERKRLLCGASAYICAPVFTHDTSRESATLDKISPMWQWNGLPRAKLNNSRAFDAETRAGELVVRRTE